MSDGTSCRGRKIRRLFWDIETSPNVVYSWRIGFNINLSHENILSERKVICIGFKWEGERNVRVLRWDRNHDDKQMLREFLEVANEADELVAHYGNGFDLPWFRTRCIIHGFEPIPLYKTVDTKAISSKHFYFNSNKLDYLGHILGYGRKNETDFQLWIDVLNDKPGALDYMCRYCGRDITLLERVWKRFSCYVKPRSHAGVMLGMEKWTCPHCASDHVVVHKRRVTSSGTVQHQMVCAKCGGYYTISDSAKKLYEANKNAKK